MKTKKYNSVLLSLSGWGLSLLSVLISTILVLIIASLFRSFKVFDTETSQRVIYLFWDILIASACLFICLKFPGSFWYVPFICNLVGIASAIFEPTFWTTQMWILVSIGWGLSVFGTMIGTLIGQSNVLLHDRINKIKRSFR